MTMKLTIIQDSSAESPREWDNSCKMMLHHRRYDLPNETGLSFRDYDSYDELREALGAEYKWVFNVYGYEHGGIAFSLRPFSCPWDSGQAGFICSDEEDRDKAYAQAEAELKTYTAWCNGEVYGYKIEDDNGEEIDSCWGFIGDPEESGMKEYVNNDGLWEARLHS